MKYHRFLLLSLLTICIALTATSCFPYHFNLHDDRLKIWGKSLVEDGIRNKDENAVTDLFSGTAKDAVTEESVQHLFDFIDGEITNYEFTEGMVSGLAEDGVKTAYGTYHCNISTTKAKYEVRLEATTLDDNDPDNVGVHKITVVRDDDYKIDWLHSVAAQKLQYGIVFGEGDLHIEEKPIIMPSFQGLLTTVEGDTVTMKTNIDLRNRTDREYRVRIEGDFTEDHENGFLKEERLAAVNTVTGEPYFIVPAGLQTTTFKAAFVGTLPSEADKSKVRDGRWLPIYHLTIEVRESETEEDKENYIHFKEETFDRADYVTAD